jgi:hypothetical protein
VSCAVNVRPGLFFLISKHIQLENGSSTSQDVLILCAFTLFIVFLFTYPFIDRPSHRVAAAKRKLLVVNDPQAKSFNARSIQCTFCRVNVTLQGEGDYNLTNWDEHKAQCTE